MKINHTSYRAEDLVVGVTYYKNRANVVKRVCNSYEEDYLEKYLRYLIEIRDNAIVSGKTAEVFQEFVAQVEAVCEIMQEAGNTYYNTIQQFLKAIDKADEMLFKNKGRKYLTEAEFNHAKGVADVEFSFDNFFGWLWSLILSTDYGNMLVDDTKQLASRVRELNDVTVKDLCRIEANVRYVDRNYRARLRNLYDLMIRYRDIINMLAYIMAPDQNNFNEKNIAKLKDQVSYIRKFQKEVVKDPDVDLTGLEDIKYFVENVEAYFRDSTIAIRSICEGSLLGNLFLTDFESYRATVAAARKYFDQFSEEYTTSKEAFDKRKKQFDELLVQYLKYGSSFVKHVEDSEAAENFLKIVKKFKDASKKADKYIDIWYQMFFNMSESKEALKRFKSNCDLTNPNVKKAVDRIEDLYDKELDAYVNETYEEFLETVRRYGIEAAAEVISQAISQKSVILGNIASKLEEKIIEEGYSEMQVIAMYDWILETDHAFENAVEKMKIADESTPDYNDLVKGVEEAFGAAKEARLDFFNQMKKLTNDEQEKSYYNYCIKTMKTASLSDSEALNVMTYYQYTNAGFNPLVY